MKCLSCYSSINANHKLSYRSVTQLNFVFQVEENSFEVDAEIKDWSCKRCTLENPGDLSICQACGGSKLRSLENGKMSSVAASWTCTKCTLKNPIGKLLISTILSISSI